jgi:DNA-binding LytR/AlgR family response regulator
MEKLKISTSVGLFRVPTEDIAYIEASGNYCDVHLFNGEVVTMTFQLHYFVEAMGKLRQNFFARVGKSLIVNLNFVYAINITNQTLKLMDHRMPQSFKLRASKEALKELKNVLEQEK